MKNMALIILVSLGLILSGCVSTQQTSGAGTADSGTANNNTVTLDSLLRGVRPEIQTWGEGSETVDVMVYSLDHSKKDELFQAVLDAGLYQGWAGEYTRDWDLQRGVLRWCIAPDTWNWQYQIQFAAIGDTTVYQYHFRPLPIMDGVPWRAVDSKISNDVGSIAYGNGIFLAAGIYNQAAQATLSERMAYSMDGISWTAIDDSRLGILTHPNVLYGAGKFFAQSSNWDADSTRREIAYSEDGLTWTQIPDNVLTIRQGSSGISIYAAGKFLALGNAAWSKRAYSIDGITWTEINGRVISELEVQSIAYGGGRYVAVGRQFENGAWKGAMAYSSDGISWTRVADSNLPIFSSWTFSIGSVVYGGDKFVALNNWGGHMVYSTDGITWTFIQDENNTSGSNIGIFDENRGGGGHLAYGGGMFVAVVSGKVAYSTDGITWTVAEGSFPSSGLQDRAICTTYGNGMFITGGSKGQIWYWKK